MRINEILGEWLIMPQSIKPMGLIHKKGVGPNNRFDFKNKNNNKANETEESIPRVLGKAEASLMHGLDMAQNIIKKNYGMAEVQAKVIAQNWPPLINNIKNIYKTSEKITDEFEEKYSRYVTLLFHHQDETFQKTVLNQLRKEFGPGNFSKVGIKAVQEPVGKGYPGKLKEDEANDRAQHSIWRKNNPIGNNYMNPTDYDSAARGTHIIMDNPTELHFYKVPAENYDQAFDKWLDGKNSDNPRDHEFYDSTKDYASDHQYWGRIEPAQDQMNWPNEPDEDDDDWTDADEKEFGTAQRGEDAPPGREKQVRALKGKVDNPYAVAWANYNKSKKKK